MTDTAGVWEIELAGPGEALELSQTVAREGIQSAVDDRLVTFLVSTAAPPDDPFGD